VVLGAPDHRITPRAGLHLVAKLDEVLSMTDTIDDSGPPIKKRKRGLMLGGLRPCGCIPRGQGRNRRIEDGEHPLLLRGANPWFDVVLPIDDQIGRKLGAVDCYQSQLERFHFDSAVEGLAAYRGALAGGCGYAEVFSCPERETLPIVKTS
jgi:hypothetical protein